MTCHRLHPLARSANWFHRLRCAECRAAFASDRLIARGFAQMRAESLPLDRITQTLAAVGLTSPAPQPRLRTRRLAVAFLVIAAITVAAIAGELVRVLIDRGSAGSLGAFSPDGRFLVTIDGRTESPTVRFWDPLTGELKWEETVSYGPLRCVVTSPDGKTAALCGGGIGESGQVLLYDIENKRLRNTLTTPTDIVWKVSFSPDGKTLGGALRDGTVRLWDSATGALKRTLKADMPPLKSGELEYGVQSVAFSRDGRIVAGGCRDESLRLWDAESGELKATLRAGSHVYQIAFAPDGKTLASAHLDGAVRLWDVTSRKLINTLRGHREAVTTLAFSPDGKHLATGGWWHDPNSTATNNDLPLKGELRLWDVQAGTMLKLLDDRDGPVYSVAFSPDGKTLASTHQTVMVGAPIKLWRIE